MHISYEKPYFSSRRFCDVMNRTKKCLPCLDACAGGSTWRFWSKVRGGVSAWTRNVWKISDLQNILYIACWKTLDRQKRKITIELDYSRNNMQGKWTVVHSSDLREYLNNFLMMVNFSDFAATVIISHSYAVYIFQAHVCPSSAMTLRIETMMVYPIQNGKRNCSTPTWDDATVQLDTLDAGRTFF